MPILINACENPAASVCTCAPTAEIEADFWMELAQIEAESIGWTELAPGSYFHAGNANAQTVNIVGIPTADMENTNVLWLF